MPIYQLPSLDSKTLLRLWEYWTLYCSKCNRISPARCIHFPVIFLEAYVHWYLAKTQSVNPHRSRPWRQSCAIWVSWSLWFRIFWPETLDMPWKGSELWFLCIELTMLLILFQGMKNPSRKPLITWSDLILNHNLPCYSLHYRLSFCHSVLWDSMRVDSEIV